MSLRLLVVSDIHGEKRSLNRIKAVYHNHSPDLTVICGDITHFGNREEAVDLLEKIPTDLIGIIGNCDPENVSEAYDEVGGKYIHLNPIEFDEFGFVGLSGSKYSKENIDRFRELSSDADVFIFHQPPYGYLDKTSRGKNIGSKGLLSIIDKNGPRLVLSGHVHEDKGIIDEEGIVYLNPGPAYNDNLAIVELSDDKVKGKLI